MNKKLKFWELLEKGIEIPRLQRNYVQGVYINDRIRAYALVEAVINAAKDPNASLELDLVYGPFPEADEIGTPFYPLDGQQRLTLLWLLHWYVWQRSRSDDPINDVDAQVKAMMRKFTYSTRATSRDFFHDLVNTFRPRTNQANMKSQITESRFFRTEWFFDPTICSALNVIEVMDKSFSEEEGTEFNKIWERLIDIDNRNIVVKICDTRKIYQSDDLYIKMNGRGKLLEAIENLKADFINELGDDQKVFDDDWFVFFWDQLKNEDTKKDYYENNLKDKNIMGPDDAFYRLVCRYFIDQYASFWPDTHSAQEKDLRDIIKMKEWQELLSLESQGDYYTIEPFRLKDLIKKNVDKCDHDAINNMPNLEDIELEKIIEGFRKFMMSLCSFNGKLFSSSADLTDYINREATKYWERVGSKAPNIIPNGGSAPSNSPSIEYRVIFHAVVLFIVEKNQSPDNPQDWKDFFEAWMKFVWNITENSSNHFTAKMILIEEIGRNLLPKSNNKKGFYELLASIKFGEIEEKSYPYLTRLWKETTPSLFVKQLREEMIKAKYRTDQQYETLSGLINKIENQFHGYTRIFFLESDLTDLNKEVEINQKIIKDRWARWEEWIKNEEEMVRSLNLLQHIEKDEELSDNHIFRPANKDKEKYWINYFKDSDARRFTFLRKVLDDTSALTKKEQMGKCIEKEKETRYRDILSSDESLVKYLIDNGDNEGYVFRFDIHGMKIKNSWSKKDILLSSYAEKRGKILQIVQQIDKDFSIDREHKVGESIFLKGRIINFNYKSNNYQWDSNGKISIKDHKQIEKVGDCKNIGNLLANLAKLEGDKYIQIDFENFDAEGLNN